jgi:hypothetical protein
MVYWVIAKLATAAAGGRRPQTQMVERLGPFESREIAARVREEARTRWRERPGTSIEIVCDFS